MGGRDPTALRSCRICGCTDDRACVTNGTPCHWAQPGLCSACVPVARLQDAIRIANLLIPVNSAKTEWLGLPGVTEAIGTPRSLPRLTGGHAKNCAYHLDQYPQECTCGRSERRDEHGS